MKTVKCSNPPESTVCPEILAGTKFDDFIQKMAQLNFSAIEIWQLEMHTLHKVRMR